MCLLQSLPHPEADTPPRPVFTWTSFPAFRLFVLDSFSLYSVCAPVFSPAQPHQVETVFQHSRSAEKEGLGFSLAQPEDKEAGSLFGFWCVLSVCLFVFTVHLLGLLSSKDLVNFDDMMSRFS